MILGVPGSFHKVGILFGVLVEVRGAYTLPPQLGQIRLSNCFCWQDGLVLGPYACELQPQNASRWSLCNRALLNICVCA